VPSTTDPNGGKNFHVYAESFNGGALQCFVGENDFQFVSGGAVITYPGTTQLPPANCQSTLGSNGNITIYVPLSGVTEANPIDNRLHEVTASTMTLLEPANTQQRDPVEGSGGSFFNLIDVAQGYVFEPQPAPAGAVSRKTHGTAGDFDVDLPLSGSVGIECRQGQPVAGSHTIVVTFPPSPAISAVASATCAGNPATTSISGNTVTVSCSNVPNAQTIAINLLGVDDGVSVGDVSIPMGVLPGDTTADGAVNSADISQTKSRSGQAVSSSNFRSDVTVDGALNSADISLVKSKSGTALP
jgi:hypothetical protein